MHQLPSTTNIALWTVQGCKLRGESLQTGGE
jgi:hypothetical protein